MARASAQPGAGGAHRALGWLHPFRVELGSQNPRAGGAHGGARAWLQARVGGAYRSWAESRHQPRNIRAIYQKKATEHFSTEDAQVISYVREIISSHRVSELTFQALYGRLGEKGFVELAATVGYYAMLACVMNTFDVYTATAPEEFRI